MNIVDPSRPDYESYLLRLWRDVDQNVCRASLQSTATNQIYHFPSLETLSAFLAQQLGAGGDDAAAIETGNG